MDLSRRAVALCMEGTQAEHARQLDEARACYAQAWEAAVDDYDRAVAAHYIAHLAEDAAEQHRWNLLALAHAQACDPQEVAPLLGSLHVCLGASWERLGDLTRAEAAYALAAIHGVRHTPD